MLVLVTAISGYIGSATALACLRAGHRVRGTLRSEAKAQAFRDSWKEWEGQLEFAIVPDSDHHLIAALARSIDSPAAVYSASEVRVR